MFTLSACGGNKQDVQSSAGEKEEHSTEEKAELPVVENGVDDEDIERPSANMEQHSASQDNSKETAKDETLSDTYEELVSGEVSEGTDSKKEDNEKDNSESNVSDEEKSDFEISKDTETKYGKIHE